MPRPCTQEELTRFRDYHATKNPETGEFVLDALQYVPVERAEVSGLAAIGGLLSFFENMGTTTASRRVGRHRFTVSEAADVLFGTDADVAMRLKVRDYIERFAR